jgi:hypothetical protein
MNCSSCRYYRGTTIGYCHRYPPVTKAASTHWCGEYVAVEAPKQPIEKKSRGRLNLRPLAAEDGDKF